MRGSLVLGFRRTASTALSTPRDSVASCTSGALTSSARDQRWTYRSQSRSSWSPAKEHLGCPWTPSPWLGASLRLLLGRRYLRCAQNCQMGLRAALIPRIGGPRLKLFSGFDRCPVCQILRHCLEARSRCLNLGGTLRFLESLLNSLDCLRTVPFWLYSRQMCGWPMQWLLTRVLTERRPGRILTGGWMLLPCESMMLTAFDWYTLPPASKIRFYSLASHGLWSMLIGLIISPFYVLIIARESPMLAM